MEGLQKVFKLHPFEEAELILNVYEELVPWERLPTPFLELVPPERFVEKPEEKLTTIRGVLLFKGKRVGEVLAWFWEELKAVAVWECYVKPFDKDRASSLLQNFETWLKETFKPRSIYYHVYEPLYPKKSYKPYLKDVKKFDDEWVYKSF